MLPRRSARAACPLCQEGLNSDASGLSEGIVSIEESIDPVPSFPRGMNILIIFASPPATAGIATVVSSWLRESYFLRVCLLDSFQLPGKQESGRGP